MKLIYTCLKICVIVIMMFSSYLGITQSKKFSEEILNHPREHAKEFERLFNYNEIPKFVDEELPNRVVLENGYVKSKLINPQHWQPSDDKIVVTQVDIIFSKYPKDKEFWRTNYYFNIC